MKKRIFQRFSGTGQRCPVQPVHIIQRGTVRTAAFVQATFYRLTTADAGAIAAEYAFLIALISILAAIGMVLLGDDLRVFFEDLAASLENVSQPTADPFAT